MPPDCLDSLYFFPGVSSNKYATRCFVWYAETSFSYLPLAMINNRLPDGAVSRYGAAWLSQRYKGRWPGESLGVLFITPLTIGFSSYSVVPFASVVTASDWRGKVLSLPPLSLPPLSLSLSLPPRSVWCGCDVDHFLNFSSSPLSVFPNVLSSFLPNLFVLAVWVGEWMSACLCCNLV